MKEQAHLSEGHADGLWSVRGRSGLRVVFQENSISLKNHVWLAVDHQGALGWGEAHGVLEFSAISCHLRAAWWKEKLISTVDGGKLFPSGDVCVRACLPGTNAAL